MPPNPLRAAWGYLRGADLQEADALKAVPGPGLNPLANVSSLAQTPSGYVWHDGGTFTALEGDGGHGGDGNSAVFSCLLALSFAHIEPQLRVLRSTAVEDSPTWLLSSPLQVLLDDPNPWHDNLELWFWTQYARHCDGNAYLRKIRAGHQETGTPVELWPISPSLIQPVTIDGSGNFIDYYEYTFAAGKKEKIATQDIIHFRIGIDDRDHRLGLAPIKRLIREIASDDEATRFADQLLHNYAIPGLVVQVPEGTTIPEDAAIALKARLQSSYGTDNRGNVGILTGGATMQTIGFSPSELNLEVLHNVPETRIAAVMGIPPSVAGLGVGLEQSSNFASLRQVRENFTEVKLVPTWRMDAAKLNKQLKPDFTLDRSVFIQHDLTRVRALQEDVDAQYRRLTLGVQTYWIRPSEARTQVALPEDPELDALWLARAASSPAAFGAGASAAAKALPEPEQKQMSEVDQLPAVFEAMVEAGVAKLQPQLDRYFDDQRKRVKRALLSNG